MSRENETEFEMNQELSRLAQALRENRPTPESEFTERLDQAVDDHFPPEWVEKTSTVKKGRGLGSLGERIRRRLDSSRVILPTLAGAVGVLFVVAVVATNAGKNSGPDAGGGGGEQMASVASTDSASEAGGASVDETFDVAAPPQPKAKESGTFDSLGEAYRDIVPTAATEMKLNGFNVVRSGLLSKNRDVAREAEITLGTKPEDVQDVANKVIEVTDDHNGIVMDSKVTDGEEGMAGATFRLMIPSAQMESAVADLSEVADLKSRSQELTDITAPTNRVEDQVADSEAKIKSLLGELETTYDEDERSVIERKIRWERQEKSWAETRLNRLQRRADYTPVDLRIQTGGDSVSDDDSSNWGFTDAIDDAGKLLGVAAGVTVLALAVAIPVGLVILIALAINRATVRRSRRKILADDE